MIIFDVFLYHDDILKSFDFSPVNFNRTPTLISEHFPEINTAEANKAKVIVLVEKAQLIYLAR